MENSKCSVCGRKLTNIESIARGIGPVCYKRLSRKSCNHKRVRSCKEIQQTITHYTEEEKSSSRQ